MKTQWKAVRRLGCELGEAFTLIELLVVIAVLAFLGSIFGTALARTSGSKAFQCLNNMRQLNSAWRMYAEDNQGTLVPNPAGPFPFMSSGWVGGLLDFTSSSDNTNTDLLINHQRYPHAALLGEYIRSFKPFKCPADASSVVIAGQRYSRVRSISMNSVVGNPTQTLPRGTVRVGYPKVSALSHPSNVFIFLDELEGSLNDGAFVVDTDVLYWLTDVPASRHSSAGAFSFGDGHGEIHRWTTPALLLLTTNGSYLFPPNPDVKWVQNHALNEPWY